MEYIYIYTNNTSLDFSDATGFAGLYEVSRLLQTGTVAYFVGLILWTAFLITPSIAGGVTAVSATDDFIFTSLWIFGVVMYFVPFFILHRHMSREKDRHINQIDRAIRSLDPEDNNRGIPYIDPEPQDRPQIQQKFIELQQVRETREYPVNVTILEDLIIGALAPLLFEWGVSVLL